MPQSVGRSLRLFPTELPHQYAGEVTLALGTQQESLLDGDFLTVGLPLYQVLVPALIIRLSVSAMPERSVRRL
jgi:hypothetical protein